MRTIIYSLMFLLTTVNITAQQTPASKQAEPITIEGAKRDLGTI